ncbi:MAG TPA: hypothetical protein VHW96_00585 [Solirubrobacteraceae bacterium]|jgi:hypothetical protein|nr:hypothetical protein [Solirubrobacteraceae bacterium]
MTTLSSSPARRALALAILATAAGAVVSPSAWADGAATFCVHQSGYACPANSTDEGTALQTALDDAAAQAADATSPNVIVIGPGTYSGAGSGFSYPSSNPLRIEGAGASTSTLTAAPSAGTVLLLGSAGGAQTITVSGLTITVPAQDGLGLNLTGGAADHIAVTFDAAYATGVRLTGATLSSSSVSGVNNYAGVTTQGPHSELDDDTVAAREYGVLATGPTTTTGST